MASALLKEKNAVKWDKEKTVKLIEEFESFPELWNCSIAEYRDRNKKAVAIKKIADTLGLSETEITRKWHNLRCQMNSEIRKMKKKKSGAGADDVVWHCTWEYFELLQFMTGYSECLKSTGSLSVEESLQEGTITDGTTNSAEQNNEEVAPSTLSNKKKRKLCQKNAEDKEDQKSLDRALAIINKPTDDNTVFGEYVASELRQLRSEKRRRTLKRIIQRAILKIGEQEEKEEENEEEEEQQEEEGETFYTSSASTPLPQSSPCNTYTNSVDSLVLEESDPGSAATQLTNLTNFFVAYLPGDNLPSGQQTVLDKPLE